MQHHRPDEKSEDVTSTTARAQNIQYQYPPCLPVNQQQYHQTSQNRFAENVPTRMTNPGYPSGGAPVVRSSNNEFFSSLNPENTTASQHYALQQQQPLHHHQQQPPPPPPTPAHLQQQQHYYQLFPQQQPQHQINLSPSDVNTAIQITSALLNHINANTGFSQPQQQLHSASTYTPPIIHDPVHDQNNAILNQPTSTSNFDVQTHNDVLIPYSQLLQQQHVESQLTPTAAFMQSFQPANNMTMEDDLLYGYNNTFGQINEVALGQIKVKQRKGNTTTKRKKRKEKPQGEQVKRKAPPVWSDAMELKISSKPTKKLRQSDVKLENRIDVNILQDRVVGNEEELLPLQGSAKKEDLPLANEQPSTKVARKSKKGEKQTNSTRKPASVKAESKSDRACPTAEKNTNVLEESVVVAEDEKLVTPYIFTVLGQLKRCTLDDKEKQRRSQCCHDVGFPGLECIHCAGPNSQKYFFCNTQSINANLHKISDHLMKCSGAPDTMKKSLIGLKHEHKRLKSRDCKSFIDGVWKRLHGDDVTNDSSDNKKDKSASKPAAPMAFVDPNKNQSVIAEDEHIKAASKPNAQKSFVDANEKQLLLAEDEQLVNAFCFFVMSQYQRGALGEKDKKHRRNSVVVVGTPGLECIHCAGQNSRKFFFTNAHGIYQNFFQLYSHLSECSGASDTLKKTLSELQEKYNGKSIDRESFFNGIWGRLHGEISVTEQTNKSANGKEAAVNSSSLVLAEDKQLINDFTFTVLSQYRRCNLDQDRSAGSQKKFDHGHPGLECIHCAGPRSRKFFYATSELLKSNFCHLCQHLSECSSAPATLKKTLVELKNEQSKQNHLHRASFFNAIWARMHLEQHEPEKKYLIESKDIVGKIVKQKEPKRSVGNVCAACKRKKVRCDGKRWFCLNKDGLTTIKGEDRDEIVPKRRPKEENAREVHFSTNPIIEDSFLCKVVSQGSTQIDYPHAPMGQLWLDKSFAGTKSQSDISDEASIDIHAGGTLIGRRYVWDEGYFVDQHHDVKSKPMKKINPILRGCTCGADHSYIKGTSIESDSVNNVASFGGKSRRSERSGGSIRTSTVLAKLADGTLSPHTLISCDEYTMGPEYRFKKDLLKENVQPFSIRVSPDALFLADLHAHLSDSEIIGFLGGHYSLSEKCIYIQAAFPCKATDRVDAGDTDVEMDPVSQIYAREAISNHGLSVVGWYHSHPTFQPNPSVTDIENQASYQQLFQGDNESDNNRDEKEDASTSTMTASPFVGLIIGTYDGQNPTSESVMRWFHVVSKKAEGKKVNFPMQLKTTHRHFRVLDDELRPVMTSQGASIRQDLESKYLSCPITKQSHPQITSEEQGSEDDKTYSAVSTAEVAKQQSQNKRPDDYQQDNYVQSCSATKTDEDCRVAIMEMKSDMHALMLSESLFECQQGNGTIKWKFKSALPLYFTTKEKEILQMDTDAIPNDVLAGIIWLAVEREHMKPSETGSLLPASVPPSSRAILELLLRLSFTESNDMQRKLYEIIHSLEGTESENDTSSDEMIIFDDIDAVISHKVDAVLSHYYSSKQKNINPFKSWTGAGDKGRNIDVDATDTQLSWAHYYLTEVLHMGYDEVENKKVYKGGSRMKRGQKIAACLLKWARRMQLRPDFEAVVSYNSYNEGDLMFDGKTSTQHGIPIKNGYIFVVAEVMRLLASRWRETTWISSRQRRRG